MSEEDFLEPELARTISVLQDTSRTLLGYGNIVQFTIAVLVDIRSCQVCTLQGNGYCNDHNISDKLTVAVEMVENISNKLEQIGGHPSEGE